MNYKMWLERAAGFVNENRAWFWPACLALLGLLFLWKGIEQYKERLGYGMTGRPILVATSELQEGHVLSLKDLSTLAIPEKLLPAGYLTEADGSRVVGVTVVRPIPKGAMVFWSDLDVSYAPTVPARRIAKGYRALAVPVDPVTSVGNSIRPGDHVDVVTSGTMPGASDATTFTLLQNVAVLDTGLADQNNDEYSTLTLMVLPKEAGVLTFARDHGRLTFILRNPNDYQTSLDLPMVQAEHVVETAFRNSIQQERNTQSVQIIRGGETGGHSDSP